MADAAMMNMVDFDPIEGDYEDGGGSGKSYAPPPEGRYFGQAPIITDANFGTTREGKLKVTLDPITVVNPGGEGDGYEVRFTQLSAKPYAVTYRKGSQAIDFIRACGINANPQSLDELKNYLKMCSGKTFQFALQWEAYNKDTQTSTKGMDNFPLLEDGKRQTFILDGDKKKVYANGKVRYTISAVGGK